MRRIIVILLCFGVLVLLPLSFCDAGSFGSGSIGSSGKSSGSAVMSSSGSSGGKSSSGWSKPVVSSSSGSSPQEQTSQNSAASSTKQVSSSVSSQSSGKNSWFKDYGWQEKGNNVWYRQAGEPASVDTIQVKDWYQKTLTSTASKAFEERTGPSVTTETNWWQTYDLKGATPKVAFSEADPDKGGTNTGVTYSNKYQVTTFAEYTTEIPEGWAGTIKTDTWNAKHFGEYQVTPTYNAEVLTPTGSGAPIATGTVHKPTVKLGKDTVVPEQGSMNYQEHAQEIQPSGEKSVTVGSDGNPMKVSTGAQLSDSFSEPTGRPNVPEAKASTSFADVMARSKTTSPPIDLSSAGVLAASKTRVGNLQSPRALSQETFTLTTEQMKGQSTFETRLLGEENYVNTYKMYETYLPARSFTEVKTLGIAEELSPVKEYTGYIPPSKPSSSGSSGSSGSAGMFHQIVRDSSGKEAATLNPGSVSEAAGNADFYSGQGYTVETNPKTNRENIH